jgi:hypothetical protein
MLLDQSLNPIDLDATEAAASLKPNRYQPELGREPLTLDVHMWRLGLVAGVEEQPVGTLP